MKAALLDPPTVLRTTHRYRGVLVGTAVGDALGLPAEGLSAEKIRRRWRGNWRHRLVLGRGMVSDDTEHTAMVAQCLLELPLEAVAFQRALARRLRWWLLALPAGAGFATGRAIGKLWLGVPPGRSGVASAGNGPLMRSAIIGARFADDRVRRRAFVDASTRLTHTDPRAEIAARAVADLAAALCREDDPSRIDVAALLKEIDPDPRWRALIERIAAARAADRTVAEFARELGLERGVSGYAWHTLPVAVYAWWRHRGDFRAALEAVLNCGGDTDTVGAITGALVGAELGEAAIPAEWVDNICDWPRSIHWLRRLGERLAEAGDAPANPLPLCWPAIPCRNLLFLGVVLAHGFARLIPR